MKKNSYRFLVAPFFLMSFSIQAMDLPLKAVTQHLNVHGTFYAALIIGTSLMIYANATEPFERDSCPVTLKPCFFERHEQPFLTHSYWDSERGYLYELASGCVENICGVAAKIFPRLARHVSRSCQFADGEADFILQLAEQNGPQCVYDYFASSIDQSLPIGRLIFKNYAYGHEH